MKFTKVALIGAGAVGAYFIYGFTSLKDLSFCVVAEGERAERLRKEGVVINEKTYYPEIKSPQEAKGADLILVCTKVIFCHENLIRKEKWQDSFRSRNNDWCQYRRKGKSGAHRTGACFCRTDETRRIKMHHRERYPFKAMGKVFHEHYLQSATGSAWGRIWCVLRQSESGSNQRSDV